MSRGPCMISPNEIAMYVCVFFFFLHLDLYIFQLAIDSVHQRDALCTCHSSVAYYLEKKKPL